MEKYTDALPASFQFGTSTAAHQVEGGLTNNWSEWCAEEDVECAGSAVNHYHQYEEDYDIAADLNHDIHRFSVAWSRVMPAPNVVDYDELAHYRDRVIALRERGIEPMVTLWHFSHPTWFAERGGWESGPVDAFQRFVEVVVDALGDLVTYWVTLNEPQGFAWLAYGSDWWPPQRNSVRAYLRAERHLVQAHDRASRYIHRTVDKAQVGIAASQLSLVPKRPLIGDVLLRLANRLKERRFVRKLADGSLDFLGVNYYFHRALGVDGVDIPETADERQPPFPSRLDEVVRDTWEAHNLPLFVTETGTADAGKRSWYLRESVGAVNEAARSGVPVRGYLYWTLLDCYEWHSGWSMNFGLVEADGTNRRVRSTGEVFAALANRAE